MRLGGKTADIGNLDQRQTAFGDQRLGVFDPAVGEIAVRRRPGRRLEGPGEMERAEAGLVRQRLDRQVFAEMGIDEIRDPPEAPGPRWAAAC